MYISRNLKINEIKKLNEIDRSEIINKIYYYRNNKLILEPEFYDMKGFPDGELENIIKRQIKIINNNGFVIGVFDNDLLIGVTSLENKIRGNKYIKMDILFVSNKYRKKGIGKKLINEAKDKCKILGGNKLYISATPSESTVNFYINNGATFVKELDLELYDMEPEDIHLEICV